MFNSLKLARNSYYKSQIIDKSDFYHFIQTDLIARLESINHVTNKILIVTDSPMPLINDYFCKKSEIICLSLNQIIKLSQKPNFDLIICPFIIHWINDVEFFFHQINNILDINGIFTANFAGNNTLRSLRTILIKLESDLNLAHKPHISPFIQLEQMPILLKQAGFSENIIDAERLELEFSSPLDLMRSLQLHGQSNSLKTPHSYLINKSIYQKLTQLTTDNKFVDQVNLISFIASKHQNTIKMKIKNSTSN